MATNSNRPMTALEWSMLIALSVAWGCSFFFVGSAVAALPTLTIAFLRVSMAALILHLVLIVIGQRFPMRPRVLLGFMVLGFLNNALPFSLIIWSQKYIPSGLASILNATTPLFTVVAAHVLTANEKLTTAKIVSVLLGLAGVTVLFAPSLAAANMVTVAAQGACLVAALSYAFAGIYGRRFGPMGVSPLATATGQVTASTLWLLPSVLIVDQPWTLTAPSAPVWMSIAGLVLISTVASYVLYFRLLSTAGATNVLLVTFLIPVSAILLGWLFLDEHLRVQHFVGMAIIGLSLAIIDGRLLSLALGSMRPRAAKNLTAP